MVNLYTVFFVWVIGFGILFLLVKRPLTSLLIRLGVPTWLGYYIIVTPLIFVEEFLTCETPFWSCIKITLWVFYFLFFILFWIQKYFRLSWPAVVGIFGLIGWFNEFILVGRIIQYPLQITIVVSPLAFLIYAVLAIMPSYFLQQSLRRENRNR